MNSFLQKKLTKDASKQIEFYAGLGAALPNIFDKKEETPEKTQDVVTLDEEAA